MKYSEESKNKKIEVANEYADIRKVGERPVSFSESAEVIKKKAEEEAEAAKERTKGKILRVLSYSGVKEEEKLSAQKIEEIVRGDVGKTLEELKAEVRELEKKFASALGSEKQIIEKTIEKKEERIRRAEDSVKEKTSVGGGWVDLAKYGSVRPEEEVQESVVGAKKISDIAHPSSQKEVPVEINWEPMISSRLAEVKNVSELEDAMRFVFQKTGEKTVGEREKAFSAALALRRAIEEEKAPQFNANMFPERFRASVKQVMDAALLYDDEEFDVEQPTFLKKATDKSIKIESVGNIDDLNTLLSLQRVKSNEETFLSEGKKYSYDALSKNLLLLNHYFEEHKGEGGRIPVYYANIAESFPTAWGLRDALFDVIKAKGFSLTEPMRTATELAKARGGEILWEEKAPRTVIEKKEEEIAPVVIHTEEKKESSSKPVFPANDFAKTARENQEGIKNPKVFPFSEDEKKEVATIPSKIEREEDAFASMGDIFKFLTEVSSEEKLADEAERDRQMAYKNARILQWRNLIEYMHPADRKAFAEETRQIRSMYSFPDWDKKEESERQALNNERLNNLREVFLRHGFIPSAKKGESASPDNPWHWIPPKNTRKFDAQNAERYLVSYDDEKKGTGLLRGDKRYRTQTVNIEKENLDIDPAIEGAKTLEEFEDAVTARMEKGLIIERGNELPPEAIPALFGALEMYCENPEGDFYADGWPERHGIRATAKRIAEEAKKKIEDIDVEKLEKEHAETIGELHSLGQKQKIDEPVETPVVEEKPEKKKEEKIPRGVFSAPSPEASETPETPVSVETKEEGEEKELTPAQKINALIVLGFLSEADQVLIPTGEAEKVAFLKKYTQYFEDLSECIKEEKTVSGKKDKKKGGLKNKEYKASRNTILEKANEVWEKQQVFNAIYKEKVLKSMVERKSLSDTKYALCDDAEKALSGAMTDLNKFLERGWRGLKEGGVKGLEKKDDKDVEKEIQKDAELVSAPFGTNERTGEPIVRSFRWMMIRMNRLAYERKQDAVSRSMTEAWPTPEKKSFFERIPLAGRAIQKFNKLPKWARVAASVGLVSGSAAVGGGLVAGLSLGSLLGFMGIKVIRGVGGGIGGAALAGVLGRRIEEKSSETLERDKQFVASSMNSEMLREAQNENYLTNIRLKKYDDVAKLSSQIGERLAIAERVLLTSSRERVMKSEKFRRGLMMLTIALLAGGGTMAVTELLSGGVDTLANIKMPNLNVDPNSMKTMNPDMLGKIARDIQKGI